MDKRQREKMNREWRMMALPMRKAEEKGKPWKVATGVLFGINVVGLAAYLVYRNKS